MAFANISINDIKKEDNLLRIGNNNGVLFSGQGSVIKGTVTGVGKDAQVTIGDRRFKVTEDIVKGREIGDEMMFKVETMDGNKVKLKAMQDYVGAGVNESGSVGETLKSMNSLKIDRDTEQFVSILGQSDLSVDITSEVSDEAHRAARLSSDDLKYLRQMGIDVTNADLSHLMGLVNQHRAIEEGRSFETGSPEVIEAIAKAQSVDHISEGAMHYMMDEGAEMTFANLYQAEYSGTSYPQIEELSDESWAELKPQAEGLLERQGIEANDKALEAAKWMIEQGVDITKKNVEIYLAVQNYNENGLDSEAYEANVIDSLRLGEEPTGALLVGDSYIRQASNIVNEIENITVQALDEVVSEDKKINIRNLSKAQKSIDAALVSSENVEESLVKQNQVLNADKGEMEPKSMFHSDEGSREHVKMLTEVKLRLTVSSTYTMLKSGLDVRELGLDKIIDEFNNIKEPNLEEMFRDSGVDSTLENVDIYQETMMITRTIPSLPAATLGVVDESEHTLRGIYQAGLRVSMALNTAGRTVVATAESNFTSYYNRDAKATYEALMTAPRADMGDKISSAFANMDEMLDELNVDNTELNKKAVRILAYNQMEINAESIDRISALDTRLTEVVNGMKPETVLGMIRDNVNPLEMTLDELAREILVQEEKNGASAEQKYSEFLVDLDSKGDITAEERESYIGIYRLINQVTSFSDRDLGAVVKNGEEITLESLLRSHRSRNAAGVDVAVDDDFGSLESLVKQGKSIIEQVMSAFYNDNEAIGNRDEAVVNALDDVNEESVNLLKSLKLPYTPAYLEAAKTVLNNSSEFYQNIKEQLKIRNSSNIAFDDLEEKIYEHLAELESDDQTEIADSQDDAETDVKESSPLDLYEDNWFVNAFADAFHANDAEMKFTARDLQAGSMIQRMMRVANGMRNEGERSYMIPIAMGDDVLTMNVKFERDDTKTVKMMTGVDTRTVGRVESALAFADGKVTLHIGIENEDAIDRIASYKDDIVSELSERGIKLDEISIVAGSIDVNAINATFAGENQEVQTRNIYEVAKSMVALIRRM